MNKKTAAVECNGSNEYCSNFGVYDAVIKELLKLVTTEDPEVAISAAKELRWWLESTEGLGTASTPKQEVKTITIYKRSDLHLWSTMLISAIALVVSVGVPLLRLWLQ